MRRIKVAIVASLVAVGALLAAFAPAGASPRIHHPIRAYSNHMTSVPLNFQALAKKHPQYVKTLYLPRFRSSTKAGTLSAAAAPAGYTCWTNSSFNDYYNGKYVGVNIYFYNTLEAVAGYGPHELFDVCWGGSIPSGYEAIYSEVMGTWMGANIYDYDLLQQVTNGPGPHELVQIRCWYQNGGDTGRVGWWMYYNNQLVTTYDLNPYYLYGNKDAQWPSNFWLVTNGYNPCTAY
jgi:hypothetical protein